jgi:hypothetical protein
MKRRMVQLGCILCLCGIALAASGCSGKNNAGQTDQANKITELNQKARVGYGRIGIGANAQ